MSARARTARVLIATVALALGGAAPAGSHTAEILIQSSTLVYQQIPGISVDHDNHVKIAETSEESGSYYVVEDPQSTGMFFPAQCTPLNTEETSVRCPATGVAGLYVRVGNAAKAEPARTSTIAIGAPTPATLSGGSATVDAGTSDVTAPPVGGNVLYGGLGGGRLSAGNGAVDFIHTCPADTVEADLEDIPIADCAVIPEPPGTPPPKPKPGAPTPPPAGPGAPSGETPAALPPAPSAAVAVTYKQPQALLRRRCLRLTVSVATALTVRVRASIGLPGSGSPLRLAGRVVRLRSPGATATLRLLLPRAAIPELRRAFSRRRRVFADVQINASAPGGSSSFALARRIRVVP